MDLSMPTFAGKHYNFFDSFVKNQMKRFSNHFITQKKTVR